MVGSMVRTASSATLLPVVGAHPVIVSSTLLSACAPSSSSVTVICPLTSTLGLDATVYLDLGGLARLADRDWRLGDMGMR